MKKLLLTLMLSAVAVNANALTGSLEERAHGFAEYTVENSLNNFDLETIGGAHKVEDKIVELLNRKFPSNTKYKVLEVKDPLKVKVITKRVIQDAIVITTKDWYKNKKRELKSWGAPKSEFNKINDVLRFNLDRNRLNNFKPRWFAEIFGVQAPAAVDTSTLPPGLVNKIDPEFLPWVKRFDRTFGTNVANIKHGVVYFENLPYWQQLSGSHAAAACYRYDDRNPEANIVGIKRQYWDGKSNAEKEFIIFHELGHCLLGQGHRANHGALPKLNDSETFPAFKAFVGKLIKERKVNKVDAKSYLKRYDAACGDHIMNPSLLVGYHAEACYTYHRKTLIKRLQKSINHDWTDKISHNHEEYGHDH